MTLLGCHEDDEYLPEFGTIVLRDQGPGEAPEPLEPPENELLEELETEALSGTVATAGYDWLHATATDRRQVLRVEAHDTMPPLESAEWDDVVELPFHSSTGIVATESLTGNTKSGDRLSLGTRGMLRARVARRPAPDGARAADGDAWLIQFWPADGVRPPRWLQRTRSPFGARNPGWDKVLGDPVIEVLRAGTGPETERLADWLDQPLPTQLSSIESLETACAQLGVPLPVTRRDVLPLLLAAGLLVEQDDGGYRHAEDPPPATTLRLPTELATRIDTEAIRARYIWAGSDLVCVAAWQNPASTDGLAELLLLPEDEVAPLLDYAVADGLIHRDGTEITALPRPEPQPGQPHSETETGSTADPLRNFAVRTMPWTPE